MEGERLEMSEKENWVVIFRCSQCLLAYVYETISFDAYEKSPEQVFQEYCRDFQNLRDIGVAKIRIYHKCFSEAAGNAVGLSYLVGIMNEEFWNDSPLVPAVPLVVDETNTSA